jgi:NAD(P)-dependent dehydrogenase (short-subunit alcohol dehydrogenase family)
VAQSTFAGKVALITGAPKRIGRSVALRLASEGADVIVNYRGSKPEAEEVVAQIVAMGRRATAIQADVAKKEQVDAMFAAVEKEFGRLDILVNNAGAFDGGPLDELTTEAWDKVIAVNLRAPFLCTREAMRVMKRQGGGRIINIGSISAQRVRPGSAAYSASKHGIWGLTQVTALEGRPFGITCGCLHPGNVLVERRQGAAKKEDEEPMMTVDELAQAAVLMATLPPHVNFLEAIVLPVGQEYIGRG